MLDTFLNIIVKQRNIKKSRHLRSAKITTADCWNQTELSKKTGFISKQSGLLKRIAKIHNSKGVNSTAKFVVFVSIQNAKKQEIKFVSFLACKP